MSNRIFHRAGQAFDVLVLTTEQVKAQYQKFLEDKMNIASLTGLDVQDEDIHPALQVEPFCHQAAIVKWALRGGNRLIGAQFGLGKTSIQSEIVRQAHRLTGLPTLIIGELNVRHQFMQKDGPRLGIQFQYVTSDADIESAATPFLYTNYERVRDGGISPECLKQFVCVCLDEASVLADYGNKTFQTFCNLFRDTKYKFCASATPARNKYKELLHYAHFLGIADSGQGLTRYFKRNSTKANELTLMESMEEEFWMWVSSWAIFVEKPSDLGFSDEGYDLPPLDIEWVRIGTDHAAAQLETDGWGQYQLIANVAKGVTQASREARRSMEDRLNKMLEIINSHSPDTHWLIWHHLEAERELICKRLPAAVDVYGSQSLDVKEQRLVDFSDGKFRFLVTKPSIAGKGCNFQHHCSHMIFVGVQYSFEEMLQAIKRLHRFQQFYRVKCFVIFTEAQDEIVQAILKKWKQHDELVGNTTEIIKKFGLSSDNMKTELRRTIGVKREEVKGDWFTAIHNDTVAELPNMADNSIDLICTSIPFGNQYEYTESKNDFGYNEDNAAFWQQMDFLIPQLLRVLKPGRCAAIHVKDRIRFGNVTGYGVPTLEPFSDDCSFAFRKHGFLQLCRQTIVNDVVRENNQTYRLTYSEMLKDSTKMGSGTPEYWLIFRKPQSDFSKAYADEPVTHDRPSVKYVCRCGFETDSLDGCNSAVCDEDIQSSYMSICPNCHEVDSFVATETGGFPLSHWQIYASEYWRSSGNRLIRPDEVRSIAPDQLANMDTNQIYNWYAEYSKTHTYDLQEHLHMGDALAQKNRLPKTFMLFAPGVPDAYRDSVMSVHDYTRMQCLNGRQTSRRRENHVCPLPLDLIERIIEERSNPGDVVFDPFGGIGSTVYQAIKMGRKGIFTELNREYWESGVYYCREIELQRQSPTLFDLIALEESAEMSKSAWQVLSEKIKA